MSNDRANSRSTRRESKQKKECEEAKWRRIDATQEWFAKVREWEAWWSVPHSQKRYRTKPEEPPSLKVWLAQRGLK
jgi:hypothetical protein